MYLWLTGYPYQIGELIVQKVLVKNKNTETQFLLTEILPRLAAFDSATFKEDFLENTFNYLTSQVIIIYSV